MSRFFKPLIFVVLIGGVASAGFGPETAPAEPQLLRDGFALAGVDGKLIGSDSNDVWFFELSEDVNEYRAEAKAGTRLQLHASSTLERMIADAKARSSPAYRLWNAEVTRYKGRNYIFPRYFLPLRETEDGKDEPRASDPNMSEVAVNEPNDVLTVPAEIIGRLKARRGRPTTAPLREITDHNDAPAGESGSGARSYERNADSVFVDRTGFLIERDDGGLVFVPDALGRNVQRLSLRLLPCGILERTERKQSAALEPLRFKIAGILTEYKDEKYLLLRKATRAYSHGNFGR